MSLFPNLTADLSLSSFSRNTASWPWGHQGLLKSLQIVNSFFQMKEGDLVILNDPQAGGYFPMGFTCVSKTHRGFEAWIFPVNFIWTLDQHCLSSDQEGLRIPPTPLVLGGEVQTNILSALEAHPQGGSKLAEILKSLISINSSKIKNLAFSPSQASKNQSELRLWQEDLPHGSAEVESHYLNGETLRLAITSFKDGLHLDFSGTKEGSFCFLNEALTVGLCHRICEKYFGWNELRDPWSPMELQKILPVNLPQNSFLRSKFPQGQVHGSTRGLKLIETAVLGALDELYRRSSSKVTSSIFIQLIKGPHNEEPENFFFSSPVVKSTDYGTGTEERVFMPALDALSVKQQSSRLDWWQSPGMERLMSHFNLLKLDSVKNGDTLLRHLRLKSREEVRIGFILADPVLKKNKSFLKSEAKLIINREQALPFGRSVLSPGDTLEMIL